MKNHTEGCAVVRTSRCTCAYLSQWDENAPTAKEAVGYAKDSYLNAFGEEVGTSQRGAAAPMCVAHGRIGWHYKDAISCADWEKELDRTGADKKPEPQRASYAERILTDPEAFKRWAKLNGVEPVCTYEEKDHYPQVNKPGLQRLTVNGDIWGPIEGNEASVEYWKGKAQMYRHAAHAGAWAAGALLVITIADIFVKVF